MRPRRPLTVAVVATVWTLALTACGGGGGLDPAQGGHTGRATTISVVAAGYSDRTPAFWDAFAQEYRGKYGYTVDVEVVDRDDVDERSAARVREDRPPDVLTVTGFGGYADEGLLRDADEVLPSEVRADLLPVLVESGTREDRFVGFPAAADTRALFYDVDLFEQAGLTAAPRTWDELAAAARRVGDGGDGQDVGYALPLGPEGADVEFAAWLSAAGGSWRTDDGWSLDAPENLEALRFLTTMDGAGLTQDDPAHTDAADAAALFRAGRAGMVLGSVQLARDLDDDGTVDYRAAPFPSADGGPGLTLVTADRFVAVDKPGNEDALRAFFELYYSKKQSAPYLADEGLLPVTTSGLAATADRSWPAALVDGLGTARSLPTDDPDWTTVGPAVAQGLGAATTGDPAAVLRRLQRTATADG